MPRSAKRLDQAAVGGLVERSPPAGQRVPAGNDQAVGQLGVVQDGPAAGQSPHDRAVPAGAVAGAVLVLLKIPQRQRRLPASRRIAGSSRAAAADHSSSISSTAMFHAPAGRRVDQ